MDELRVKALRKLFPIESAKIKMMDQEDDVGEILGVLELDRALGAAAMEFSKLMSGEDPVEIYHLLFSAIESFRQRAEEMFPGLSREEKEQLNESIRSVTCPTNKKV